MGRRAARSLLVILSSCRSPSSFGSGAPGSAGGASRLRAVRHRHCPSVGDFDRRASMTTMIRAARRGAATLMLLATGACASGGTGGGISDILGAVLGGGATGAGGGGSQVSGVVRGVDTRAQQIGLQLSNGQTVGLSYDAQTKVVYNNQSYAVTSLDAGDQVTARV